MNQTLLDSITGAGPAVPVMTLNLFPNVVYTAILDDVEDTNPGRAWKGTLEGEPLSSVVLAVVDGVVAGHVSVPGALYEIRGDEDGTAVIAQVDRSLLPPKGPPRVAPRSGRESMGDPPIAGAPTTIDVAIFYTPGARRSAGNAAKIKAVIAAAAAQSNQTYEKSGIQLRIKTVFVGQINYGFTGDMDLDLDRLTDTADRFMDAVHSRRDRTKADLVHLIVAPDPSFCGLAWLGTDFSPEFGFGVTSLDCISDFTVVHEMGHNMGATHDWYIDDEPGWFDYSHGYVEIKRGVLTVMAYDDACRSKGVKCVYIAFFSTPNRRFMGRPLGVNRNARTNCRTGIANPKCAADNRTTLNKTRRTIERFR